jgi:hypothetical protein
MARRKSAGPLRWAVRTVQRNRKISARRKQRSNRRGPGQIVIGPDGTIRVSGGATAGAKAAPKAATFDESLSWLLRRNRLGLAPVGVGLALVIAARVLASYDTTGEAAPWIGVGGVGAAIFAATGPWATRAVERAYAATVAAAGALWLLAASRFGPMGRPAGGISLAFVLVAAGAVLAGPWWYHHRSRRIGASSSPSDRVSFLWAARVAVVGGCIAGSTLGPPKAIPGGTSRTVFLNPGKTKTADAIAATPMVSSALEIDDTSVFIDRSPTRKGSQAQLFVLDDNPLHKPLIWPGPTPEYRKGYVEVGRYADGEPILWRLWQPDSGPWHDLISGTTGAGKSRLLDLLLVSCRSTGLVVNWIIDPDQGQSLPQWVDNVEWAVTDMTEAKVMLRAAVAVMNVRQKALAARRLAHFNPSPEFPVLNIVIDEAHAVLADQECVKLVEQIGKRGRKTGVRLTLVTQLPSVVELGNSLVIRSMITGGGNVAVFRTGDRLSGAMAFSGALPVDPSAIPREIDGATTAGTGYFLGMSNRLLMGRTYAVGDCAAFIAEYPMTLLDAASAAARDAVVGAPRPVEAPPAAPIAGPAIPPLPSLAYEPPGPADAPEADEEGFPIEWADSPELPAPALPVSQAKVYGALPPGGGLATNAEIVAASGLAVPTVRRALTALKAAGLAVNPTVGNWGRTL